MFRSPLFIKAYSVIILMVFLFSATVYLATTQVVNQTVDELEAASGKTILDNVYELVDKIYKDIKEYERFAERAHKQELKNIMAMAVSYVHGVLKDTGDTPEGKKRALEIIVDKMRQFRYGNNDYIWIADYKSLTLSHPTPKLHGGFDASKLRDVRGNLIVVPVVEMAQEKGTGFHRYWWQRLGKKEPSEKLTYFQHVPELKIVLGTGVYLDDIKEEVARRKSVALHHLRQRLSQIKIAKTGYMYIFDSKGEMIHHPNKYIIGKNVLGQLKNPRTNRPIIDDLMAVANQPEGLHYLWDRPAKQGQYVYEKIAWVRHHKTLDWYISASVYVEELRQSRYVVGQWLLLISLTLLFVSLILGYLFIRRLVDPIKQLSDMALKIKNGVLNVRSPIKRKDEIGTLASSINAMVQQLQSNIEQLDSRIRERTAELEKTNQQLKHMDRMKSDFLSSVSHELRTPLTSIRGFTSLIKKEFQRTFAPLAQGERKTARKAKRVGSNLDIIISESERLTRLINDVLDLAKIESGKFTWNDGEFDVFDMLKQAASSARGQFEAKPALDFKEEISETLGALHADRDKIIQVVINLLNNAAKFTEQGQVTLRAFLNPANDLQIEVQDTGSGISKEQCEHVFDKFHQVVKKDTLVDKPGGTGLGLSICREVVNHYAGEIWVESEVGKGSTFSFTLPLSPFDDASSQKNATEPEVIEGAQERIDPVVIKKKTEPRSFEGKSYILVVDDSEPVRTLLSQILEDAQFNVDTAEHGQEAIEKVKQKIPDLITMDLMMPVMDGATTIRHLRRDPKFSAIPIVVISAQIELGNQRGDAQLAKPVREHELVTTIRMLLRQSKTSSIPKSEKCLFITDKNDPPCLAKLDKSHYAPTLCSPKNLWQMIEDFHGTVIVPPQEIAKVDLQKLVNHPRIQVIIPPTSED
ncbi:cache domain-containing protein [Magnetococcales bacterium HHB-1]